MEQQLMQPHFIKMFILKLQTVKCSSSHFAEKANWPASMKGIHTKTDFSSKKLPFNLPNNFVGRFYGFLWHHPSIPHPVKRFIVKPGATITVGNAKLLLNTKQMIQLRWQRFITKHHVYTYQEARQLRRWRDDLSRWAPLALYFGIPGAPMTLPFISERFSYVALPSTYMDSQESVTAMQLDRLRSVRIPKDDVFRTVFSSIEPTCYRDLLHLDTNLLEQWSNRLLINPNKQTSAHLSEILLATPSAVSWFRSSSRVKDWLRNVVEDDLRLAVQHGSIQSLSEMELMNLLVERGIAIQEADVPRPIKTWVLRRYLKAHVQFTCNLAGMSRWMTSRSYKKGADGQRSRGTERAVTEVESFLAQPDLTRLVPIIVARLFGLVDYVHVPQRNSIVTQVDEEKWRRGRSKIEAERSRLVDEFKL
jgi:hypothetical protein